VRIGTLLVLFLATGAAAGAAQQDTLATMTGIVRAAGDGRPLGDAMVSLRGAAAGQGAFNVTDSTGRFKITGMLAGLYTLHIAYGGQSSEDYQVGLQPGRTLDVSILLDVKAVDLSPIVVEAASTNYGLSLAGFYARRDYGLGRFVTRDDIDRRRPAKVSAMLAGTGIVMRCARLVCMPVRTTSGRRSCPVSVFVDGLRVETYNIDQIPTQDVLGIEVYRGADTPVEFSRWSAGCGAVLIWTRN